MPPTGSHPHPSGARAARGRAAVTVASTAIVAACAAMHIMAGCAADPSARRAGGSGSGAIEGAGVEPIRVIARGLEVVASAAPTGTVSGRDLHAHPGSTEWMILTATGSTPRAPGETLTVRTGAESRHGAELAVEELGETTLHLIDVEHGPAMSVTDAIADQSVSRFDPPLALGRAEIAPGETVEAESTMVVESMENAGSERDRGRAVRRLRFAADETIRTALGELACKRVDIEFEAKLRFAEAKVRTTRWILPGVGPVAEEERERIVVLGLIPRESTRVVARVTPLALP